MKNPVPGRKLPLILGSLLFAVLPSRSQEYSIATPVNARLQLAVMDYAFQDGGSPSVGASTFIQVSALTGTLYYDAAAQTIQQVGSISLDGPANVSLSFDEHVHINGEPQSATVTLDFSLPTTLSFDTGVQPLNGSGNSFYFTAPAVPIYGTYSILAGEETLSGTFSYDLLFPTCLAQIGDVTATDMTLTEGPSSYNFRGWRITSGLMATNGMTFNLVGGISDGTYSSSWELDPATATAVPEPGCGAFVILGLAVLAAGRWRCAGRSPARVDR
jgi:hypothetical protein